MKLYLASDNANKAAEFRAMAGAIPGIEVAPASEVGGMPTVVEDTGTFSGNALKKARALYARLPPEGWSLADDSGICVEALGGAPGVESAYFAGQPSNTAANLAKMVAAMSDIPDGQRAAEFVCVLAVLGPSGTERLFEGRCRGQIARGPRGSGRFGYDPLFVPDGFEATYAEMPQALKNRIGHRGRAWALCAAWLAAMG